MRAAIITFPGSNREVDLARALHAATGQRPLAIWHKERSLPDLDLIALPGGFSYGDYLRCGAVAARSPIMAEIVRAADRGVTVIGICNGFQILTEAGLLPGALMRNKELAFLCKPVRLEVATADSIFTSGYKAGQDVIFPVAHHDGNYTVGEDERKQLEDEDRIAFRYKSELNGSVGKIAGVLSKRRNVLGLMPHPEDAVETLHGTTDGAPLFASLAAAL
jgi:phosphoribosylformylglycinamidine synthase I